MIVELSEIRKYVSINASFDFVVLQPQLEWAEETYIPDLLGLKLYDKLLAYCVDATSVASEKRSYYNTLKDKVSRIICNIAVFDWLSVAGVSISDIGLQRLEGEMGGLTRKSAFQYQERDAKEYFRRKGFNSMDVALQYIILNLSQFDEFKSSETYSDLKGDIIPDLKCFEKHYHIGGSYLLFIKLKPFIREASLFDVVPVIGNVLYKRIVTEMTEPDIKTLLPELRSAIAYKAIARGIQATSINFVDDGARMIVKDSTNSNFEKSSIPELKNLIIMAEMTGDKYLGLLCSYIRAFSVKYPEFMDNRITTIDVSDKKFIPLY